MTRIAVYHHYEYPNLKSRLKTYFLRLIRYPWLINKRIAILNFYDGEVWRCVEDMTIYEDANWKYQLEIMQGTWCEQIEVLIIKELKPFKEKEEPEKFTFTFR